MRHDRQRGGGAIAPGQDPDNVLHLAAHEERLLQSIDLPEGKSRLDFGRQAQGGHPGHQEVPDLGIGGGSDRVRRLRHDHDIGIGPLRREGAGRRIGGCGRRRTEGNEGEAQGRREGDAQCGKPHGFFSHSPGGPNLILNRL